MNYFALELHENRIVHYDLKPSNVLVEVYEEFNYNCVICDFGYANIIGDEELADSLVKGLEKPKAVGITTQYASPEVRKSKLVTIVCTHLLYICIFSCFQKFSSDEREPWNQTKRLTSMLMPLPCMKF